MAKEKMATYCNYHLENASRKKGNVKGKPKLPKIKRQWEGVCIT
jgi:hypothetical protein